MSEYKAIETIDLVKIANAIRLKKGGTDKISLEDMPAMIREIEGGGVKLPALTNEAAASELLAGKQLINDEGDVITGAMADNGTIASTMDGLNIKEVTIPAGYTSGGIVSLDNTIDNEVDIQADLLAQAVAALEGKAGGGSEPSLQSKSVTPSAVQQTVVPDSGYDGLDKVTVAAIPSTYVKPTATKTATTYTPTTSNQTIAAGTYCSGAQTIKGDANLVAGNIKSGVSIFGVAGSYEGSGGGGSVETCTVVVRNTHSTGYLGTTVATVFNGENISYYSRTSNSTTQEITIENVICGSVIVTNVYGYMYVASRCSGATSLNNLIAFHITAKNGETVTIEFYEND